MSEMRIVVCPILIPVFVLGLNGILNPDPAVWFLCVIFDEGHAHALTHVNLALVGNPPRTRGGADDGATAAGPRVGRPGAGPR